MTEYLIIVALIAISSIGIVQVTSSSIKVGFGKIADALQGKSYRGANYTEVTKAKTESKKMDDFNQGTSR